MARSDSLGQPRTVRLPHGVIGYRELGQGPAVVFVHGLLVNADLWRNVVPVVAAAGCGCLAPDWPLGSHAYPTGPGADLSPPGIAGMIEDFLAALDLSDVALVASDTGGALVQILVARRFDRIGRVFLVSCDSLELRAFLRQVHRRHTLAAAKSFGSFDRPVLPAFAVDDRLFPMSLARRLAQLLPDARIAPVANSRTSVPEDQPSALAKLITEFASNTVRQAA
jgi:pimeloyl-ACP methyl ester carboxylesterase